MTLAAQVAQLVEQGTENPRVGGSIPPLGTNNQRLGSAWMRVSRLKTPLSRPVVVPGLVPAKRG